MTPKEKFRESDSMNWRNAENVKIAEEFAIGFAEWITQAELPFKELLEIYKKVFEKQEKEIDLTNYEPEKWFNYNVDCQEQYDAIYNLKSKIKNER